MEQNKIIRFTTRLTIQDKEILDQLAKAAHKKPSAYIRSLILNAQTSNAKQK